MFRFSLAKKSMFQQYIKFSKENCEVGKRVWLKLILNYIKLAYILMVFARTSLVGILKVKPLCSELRPVSHILTGDIIWRIHNLVGWITDLHFSQVINLLPKLGWVSKYSSRVMDNRPISFSGSITRTLTVSRRRDTSISYRLE